MASEIHIVGTLTYANAPAGIGLKSLTVNKTVDIIGTRYTTLDFLAPTTAGGTALPVSNLSAIGWVFVKNNDATNYVDVMSAVSGTAFARLLPGEFCFLRLAPGITAPAVLAHTAGVPIEYLALEP